jgi:hypothetical protein
MVIPCFLIVALVAASLFTAGSKTAPARGSSFRSLSQLLFKCLRRLNLGSLLDGNFRTTLPIEISISFEIPIFKD